VVAVAILSAGATPEARLPNILILMAEDMSARAGAFGDPVARTPNLDRLAEVGGMEIPLNQPRGMSFNLRSREGPEPGGFPDRFVVDQPVYRRDR
jgi:hypothetical protein